MEDGLRLFRGLCSLEAPRKKKKGGFFVIIIKSDKLQKVPVVLRTLQQWPRPEECQ